MHIRTRFAAVAPYPADDTPLEFAQPVKVGNGTPAANAADYGRPQDLWAQRALQTSFGRAVGIRLVGGTVLKVAVVGAQGLRWMPAKAALTEQQASQWARTGQFEKR